MPPEALTASHLTSVNRRGGHGEQRRQTVGKPDEEDRAGKEAGEEKTDFLFEQ